jgi:hypothetical protein
MEPKAAPIHQRCRGFGNPLPKLPIIRCSNPTFMSTMNLHEFPRADEARSSLIGLDLDQYGAHVRDNADVHAVAHPIA